jgi:low temperature requirement protein LtrA
VSTSSAPIAPADRVSAVELFFDLVFAFTLTQLTRMLERDLTPAGAGRVLLVFSALWYMYGGYAWLTNHVPPRRPAQKLALFVGMAGCFVAAIGIPHAFDGAGLLFGGGYLVVVIVHLLVFTQSDVGEGVSRLAPYNLVGAVLIFGAGIAHSDVTLYGHWILGLFVMIVLPHLIPRWSWVGAARTFHPAAAHFVERHGLLVLIALGESVISLGQGVDAERAGLGLAGLIVLALALPGAFWWTYFVDYRSAERELAMRDDQARSLLAQRVYYFAHIPILLGIVIAAAGMHAAIAHPLAPLGWPAAVALAGGVSLFVAGVADARSSLGIGSAGARIVAAIVALATAPLGALVGGGLHLVALLAVLVAMLLLTSRADLSRELESV